jgi:hypothetical protein
LLSSPPAPSAQIWFRFFLGSFSWPEASDVGCSAYLPSAFEYLKSSFPSLLKYIDTGYKTLGRYI